MSNVYQEKPNIVEVTVEDKTGTAKRHVVGLTLDEVVEIIELSSTEKKPDWVGPARKVKRHRRTKAELAKAPETKLEKEPGTETAAPQKEKVWA